MMMMIMTTTIIVMMASHHAMLTVTHIVYIVMWMAGNGCVATALRFLSKNLCGVALVSTPPFSSPSFISSHLITTTTTALYNNKYSSMYYDVTMNFRSSILHASLQQCNTKFLQTLKLEINNRTFKYLLRWLWRVFFLLLLLLVVLLLLCLLCIK